MSDGYIDIDVRLNDAQAKSQADKMGKQLGQQISSNVDAASKTADTSTQQAMRNIGSSLTGYGTAMSKAVTIPILAGAAASGAAAVKIDTALTGVRKTVDGTEQQYEQLKQSAIEFSKTNAVDPSQILDIQALGAQLGYSIEELDKFGEVVSGLDIATNMDAETAAMELASFSNIMKMSHDDVDKYGSTIVDLGNHFATTESDISHMAQRIAGAGKQLGMSEADVLGMATALSSMGINAEAGGTAISTLMSNIDKDVATNGKNLETWAQTANMSVEDFKKLWGEDVTKALSAVFKGMENTVEEGGNLSVILDELGIGAIRQTDMIKRLANNTEMLPKAIKTANDAWEENTALTKEVDNRNASMAAQLQILFNKVQAVAIEVGEPLMKALIGVIDAAQPLIDILADGAKAFGDLDEGGQKAILMAVAAAAAFGPLTTVVGKLLSGTGKSAERWKEFSDNLKIVRTNISNATATATKGTTAFAKFFEANRDGEKTIYKTNLRTGEYVQTNSRLARTLATTTAGVKVQNIAIKATTPIINATSKAMTVAKSAAIGLGNALKTIAPMAILSAAVAIISKISEGMQKASERAKNYDKATRGLEAAVNTTTGAIKNENSALENQENVINSIDFDEFLEQHVQLADTIRETAEKANASASMLENYKDSIANLADQTNLTEPQIAELKEAVEQVNQATGKSYTVAQDADGAWRIMADGAVVAKDAILDLIEVQQMQIQLEATRESQKAAWEQLKKDSEAYADQLAIVSEKEKDLNKAIAEKKPNVQWYQDALDAEKKKLSDLADVQGKNQSAYNRLTEQTKLYGMAMREGAEELTKLVAGNIEMQAAIQSASVPLDDFVNSMNDMGISAEQLTSIMKEEGSKGIQDFANAYKNGSNDLLSWAKEHNIEIPQAYIDGLKSKEDETRKAAQTNATVALEEYKKPDTEKAGAEEGHGYATGIGSASGQINREARLDAIEAEKGLKSNNGKAEGWGLDLGTLFANGLKAAQDVVSGAANSIAGIIKNILGHSVPKEGILRNGGQGEKPWGRHMVQNIAEGMLEGKKDAIDAADEIARDISDELLTKFAAIDAMGQIEASIGRGMSAASIIANSGGISNTTTTWNINQPIATPDELMRQQRMTERYQLAGSR